MQSSYIHIQQPTSAAEGSWDACGGVGGALNFLFDWYVPWGFPSRHSGAELRPENKVTGTEKMTN